MTNFKIVTDNDLLKAKLFNRSRLTENGCWEWTGSKNRGYGLFSISNKAVGAHRVSYEAFKTPIPEGMVIRHQCDNPSCINPDHLLIGTMADNAADRELRGRRDVKGEQVGTAKLTESQVIAIKASTASLTQLSGQYGVDRSNIWSIRAGKSWKHLNQSNSVKEMNHGR